jgi:hypothetical protein
MQNFIFKTGIHISDYCFSFALPSFSFYISLYLPCQHDYYCEKNYTMFAFLKIIFAKVVRETVHQIFFLLLFRKESECCFVFYSMNTMGEGGRGQGEGKRKEKKRRGRKKEGEKKGKD